jgi:hypothetical protein
MLAPESDINQWKEDLRRHDAQRKTAQEEAMKTQFSKPVTWRDVKQKEMEYHPILQKFSQEDRENNTKQKENDNWKQKSEVQRKNVEKYLQEYNIINLDKDASVPSKGDPSATKTRLQPSCQVDYNIITNDKLDDVHFQNVRLNVGARKKDERKPFVGNKREFNIVSNKYITGHEDKTLNDTLKAKKDLNDKYSRTHDYNCLTAGFYDKEKETVYQEVRVKEQQEHGKNLAEKLPPTIRNRETIIFDPTREVPEAIKVLDQKKKDAMQKYELRYKVEQDLRERDFASQDRAEEMKLKRINPQKFTEHLEKGFDILTMNDYDKNQLPYVAKPVQTKWEKLRLTSNNTVQVQQPSKVITEKPALTSADLKPTKGLDTVSPLYKSPSLIKGSSLSGGWKDTIRSTSAVGFDAGRIVSDQGFRSEHKGREAVYNLADKYNQYCVPPKRVVDDFNTRTLPQVKIADNSLKFSMIKTGGFKRGQSSNIA